MTALWKSHRYVTLNSVSAWKSCSISMAVSLQ